MQKTFKFQVIHKSKKSHARVGRITTKHGVIETPNFVGVGTNGTIKAVDSKTLAKLSMQLMFCNTYHLIIQPGTETIEAAGGIHKFANLNIPTISDSGGFQVFSLAYGGVASEIKSKGTKKISNTVVKITEEGVLFRSYKDGKKILLTPESSILAQKSIGANIIVSFDELLPYHISDKRLEQSLHRTHRWEKRSLETHNNNPTDQALYAVIHGGPNLKLREESCNMLSSLPFDGFAIGGSLGKSVSEMIGILKPTIPILPKDKPNHLLGIGDLVSIPLCVPLGIDTFDSSHPTKAARHGLLFTKKGTLRISKSGNNNNLNPIEDDCTCPTCTNYTIAFLCHLFKAKELSAFNLATIHNIHFMVKLMESYRSKILNDEI
jgi:queuine tRNA-ribosyltransferase